MPYYIYRIDREKGLHYLGQCDKYRDAKTQVQTLRKAQQIEQPETLRMIHASSQLEAERLLLTPREAPVEGDD